MFFSHLPANIAAGAIGFALIVLQPDVVRAQSPMTPPPEPEQPPASESASEVILPAVVVTASRTLEDPFNVPFSLTVVKPEDIRRRQPQLPVLMLREEPGVWAVNVASQGSPILRGQIGNRVLYLWDGIRINNGTLFGGPNGYFNQFPLDAVDRIEVVRGSGSVQYGSDAIGGVINIISKSAEFTDDFQMRGDLYGRYGTNDDSNLEAFNLRISDMRFSLAAGLTRQEVGDYRGASDGRLSPSGFNALGGYVNLAMRLTEGQTIRLSYVTNERTDVDSYVQSRINPGNVPRFFSPVERRGILKLQYTAEDLGAWSKELQLYGYYQHYDEKRETRSVSAAAFNNTLRDTNQDLFGGGIQNTTKLGDQLKFIYGTDYRHEKLSSSNQLKSKNLLTGGVTRGEPAGNTPNGTYDVVSVFLSSEYRPVEPLLLTAGIRYERTNLDSKPTALDVFPDAGYTLADLDRNETWNSVVWNVGSILSLTRSWDLVGNIGTAFRAPTYSDLLSAGTPTFSSRIASVPSPSVDPEKAITYELGTRYHSQKFSGSLTGYYTDLTDLISSTESGTVTIPGQGTFAATRNTNIGEAYVTGVEMAMAYKPAPEWTLFANATYTYGQDETAGAPLRFIPPFNGVFGVRYESPSGRWWVEATEDWALRFTRQAPRDEQDSGFARDPALGSPNTTTNKPLRDNFDIPGFWITNLRAGYKVWERGDRNLDLTLDLNNIFNKSYREVYAQRQKEAPGFGVVIGARLSF